MQNILLQCFPPFLACALFFKKNERDKTSSQNENKFMTCNLSHRKTRLGRASLAAAEEPEEEEEGASS